MSCHLEQYSPVSNVIQIRTKVPSYLSQFNINFEEINLIFGKKPSVCFNDEVFQETSPKIINEDVSLNESDLTGNPLQVDLGNADDTLQLLVKSERSEFFWSPDETKHFPLSETETRKIIREKLKEGSNGNTFPVFVICNGGDPLKTVAFGYDLKNFMSCKVCILECIKKDDAAQSLKNMVNSHLKVTTAQESEIEYLVKMKYNIYGRSFKTLSNQNASMRNLGEYASVSVDVVCRNCVFNVIPTNDSTLRMNLEIIAGHNLLSLHSLWTDLCLLQSYIDILFNLKQSTDEYTIISKEPLDEEVILQKISGVVSSRFLKREAERKVDLTNIREGNLLDNLWIILKHCEDLSTLRDSLHFVFQELADSNIRNVLIKETSSNIATIINGILNGKLILSSLTFPQALELLFELGALKLKNDYQVILKQFSSTVKSKIEAVWSKYFSKYQPSQDRTRKSRITQTIKTVKLDLIINQLAYLTQLHIASEFIYLVKGQVELSESCFYYFCSCLEKEYVDNTETITDFLEVFQSPLCEFSFEVQSSDARILERENLFPSRWTMSINSKQSSYEEVTTTYDFSEFPVFPPVIYDNYDIPLHDEDKLNIYYASKMVLEKNKKQKTSSVVV